MTEQQRTRSRRGPTKKEQAAQLAALRARRDELDAAQAERLKAEDAALERFAVAALEVRAVYDAAAVKVADLQRQVAAVNDKATADAHDLETGQAKALLELTELGRSAEELAQMTGISVKRVRSMVRAVRPKMKPAAQPRSAEAERETTVPAAGSSPVVIEGAGSP